jgi:SnoaL-like domain
MDLQSVADKIEIHELLARYARGVDTHDWELWKSVFTEDAVIDYSLSGIAKGGRDEMAAYLAESFATIPWATHHITNFEVELDGDTAKVRAVFSSTRCSFPVSTVRARPVATTSTTSCARPAGGAAGTSSSIPCGS